METNVVKSRYSRYVQGGQSTISNDNKTKWWDRYEIPKSNSDILVEILPRFNKRPDRLAYELYGKSELGWIILQYNTVVDINEEFVTGKFFKVPHPDRVIFDLLSKPFGGVKE